MSSTIMDPSDVKPYDGTSFYIGLGLAVSSSGFIGASFIIKKLALMRLQRRGGVRASSGGFGYLKEWMWWTGLLSMGIGEAANFAAYAFAPASLVTPLGALSVLVSAILASKYLNERLNLLGKIGCSLCILGSTVFVIHSPKEQEVNTLADLLDKVKALGFLTYVFTVILFSVLIIFYLGPVYGKQNILVYIWLCSSVGSLSVVSCKGLGLALKETITGVSNGFANSLTWTCLFAVIICISVQMNYLNRSLDLFETTIVTPIYYVCFTTLVIIASAILFREWENMSTEDILGSISAFLIVIIAIFLLNAFKEMDVSYESIRHMLQPKRKTVFCSSDRVDERLLARFESDLNINHTYGAQTLSRSL